MRAFALLLGSAILIGCGDSADTTSSSSSSSTGSGGMAGVGGDSSITIGGRDAAVHVPAGYSADKPAPLVVMLPGYATSGALQELYLQIEPTLDKHGILSAHPSGTVDKSGFFFWNATDACCNYDGSTVDDSAYLSELVTEIEKQYSVDPKRVYFFGHSNGGYMAYRMACDHADQIAAIVSLAGAMWEDTTKCKPSAPVSVLEIHGTSDDEVIYGGDPGDSTPGNGPYPGAETSVKDWATFDGCSLTPDTSGEKLDLDQGIAGAETSQTIYRSGCKEKTEAALWTIAGGKHIPDISDDFREDAIEFLLAHPKP